MFQFLIGRLQTDRQYFLKLLKSLFQFLIGRLQTDGQKYHVYADEDGFQFLIGRLQTVKWTETPALSAHVSIPYR